MAIGNPEWLTLRGCTLKPSANGQSWTVFVSNRPDYTLVPVPAGGEFACKVTQTINGKRMDKGGKYPTLESAAQGGLDDLRAALGW
jgi:hypothetical protein